MSSDALPHCRHTPGRSVLAPATHAGCSLVARRAQRDGDVFFPPLLLAIATEPYPHRALALPTLLQALAPESADRLLTLLLTLPHGVLKYSHTVPGAESARRSFAMP